MKITNPTFKKLIETLCIQETHSQVIYIKGSYKFFNLDCYIDFEGDQVIIDEYTIGTNYLEMTKEQAHLLDMTVIELKTSFLNNLPEIEVEEDVVEIVDLYEFNGVKRSDFI